MIYPSQLGYTIGYDTISRGDNMRIYVEQCGPGYYTSVQLDGVELLHGGPPLRDVVSKVLDMIYDGYPCRSWASRDWSGDMCCLMWVTPD